MSSISKHRKLSDKRTTRLDEDRLSKLPDCLITKILSSLPTKYVVATSVLSTKWRRSWTSITHLDLDDEPTIFYKSCFMSFVDRVLLLVHKDTLQHFRLKCGRTYTDSQINWWITAALLCYVKEIDLSIRIENSSAFPEELFSSKRLEVLKLGTDFKLNVPILVNLSNLVVLHLCDIDLVNADSIDRLISGCPLLEELNMENCSGKQVPTINISLPKLKSLTLTRLHCDDKYSLHSKYTVLICTPSLVTLAIASCADVRYVLKDANHLKTAKLDFDYHSGGYTSIDSLLKEISQVRFLFLSIKPFWLLRHCKLDRPFENLTILDLDVECHYLELLMFLKNSPIIGTLVFRKAALCFYETSLAAPSCLDSHLKVIKFMKFGGKKKELNLVKYFLAKANVLENVIIHYHPECESSFVETNSEDEFIACKNELIKIKQELEYSNTLLKLPRVSKACQVVIL